MVTITIQSDTVGAALKELHGFFPEHGTVTHFAPLESRGAVVEAGKLEKREKKTKESAAPAEAKTEEKEFTTPSGVIPYSAVQEIVPKYLQVAKREELIKLFGQFDGAKSARDLKPEQYQAFIEAAQKAIDATPKA